MQNRCDIDYLIEEYGTGLLRLCYLYLGNMQLAEDAVQETYISVYQNYEKFQGKSTEKTWITRIAINTCKNMRRSAWMKRVKIGLEDIERRMEITEGESAENILLQRERKGEISSAIMCLSKKYREVILLYYYQEMNTNEIASLLHIPAATVRIRLTRARNMLKDTIPAEDMEENEVDVYDKT